MIMTFLRNGMHMLKSSGTEGRPPRANFMQGSGFSDGPVQIQIRGAGFKRSDGVVDSNMQIHK